MLLLARLQLGGPGIKAPDTVTHAEPLYLAWVGRILGVVFGEYIGDSLRRERRDAGDHSLNAADRE